MSTILNYHIYLHEKKKRNNSITYYNLPLHFFKYLSNFNTFKLAETNENGSKPISKFLRLEGNIPSLLNIDQSHG